MSAFVNQIVTMLFAILAIVNGLMANWVVPGTATLTPSGTSLVNSLAYLVQNLVYFLNQLLTAIMV